MKKLLFILFAILSIGISQKASAYDFSAVNSDGDTIYYRFISGSDSTVQVTYEGTVGYFRGFFQFMGKNTKEISLFLQQLPIMKKNIQ